MVVSVPALDSCVTQCMPTYFCAYSVGAREIGREGERGRERKRVMERGRERGRKREGGRERERGRGGERRDGESGETLSSVRQRTSAYVSGRQRTSAYFSIRQHTSANVSVCCLWAAADAELMAGYNSTIISH